MCLVIKKKKKVVAQLDQVMSNYTRHKQLEEQQSRIGKQEVLQQRLHLPIHQPVALINTKVCTYIPNFFKYICTCKYINKLNFLHTHARMHTYLCDKHLCTHTHSTYTHTHTHTHARTQHVHILTLTHTSTHAAHTHSTHTQHVHTHIQTDTYTLIYKPKEPSVG